MASKIGLGMLGLGLLMLCGFAIMPGPTDGKIGLLGLGSSLCVWGGVMHLWVRLGKPKEANAERQRYCTRCGSVAEPVHFGRGSNVLCLLLFLFFIVPGIIYWLWMNLEDYWGCPTCCAREIVPLSSPVAQRALKVS
jgi:hypothetical protein